MSDTQFIDHQTPIVTPWLQDVNDTVYKALGAPKTVAQAIANLGVAKQSDLNTTNNNVSTNATNIQTNSNNLASNSDRTKGSSLVGYLPSGTGATGRTVQGKLDEFVSVKDYGAKGDGTTDDTAAFSSVEALGVSEIYVPDGTYIVSNISLTKTYRGPGKVKLNGIIQFNNQDLLFISGDSPRSAIRYNSATSVNVLDRQFVMSGFRFMGRYTKLRAPVFPSSSFPQTVSTTNNLGGGMTSITLENWYAIFACANDGDTNASFKLMPFLRVNSISGSVISLNKAGEGIITAGTAQTYNWPTNNLANTDCLVISEGSGNPFQGRIAKITANTAGTITLDTVGSLAPLDFLLPAPSGYKYYRYLGSFYMDTAEVRNIADSGVLVKSKMLNLSAQQNTNGDLSAGKTIVLGGYISPLATGVVIDSTCSLSTAATGGSAEYYATDSGGHTVDSRYYTKNSTTTETYVFSNIQVTFAFGQNLYLTTNSGGLTPNRTSSGLQITGWFEP